MTEGTRRRPAVRAQAVPLARRARPPRAAATWVASTRSILAGVALLVLAVGGYLVARETSVFALERIEVEGAAPPLAARVRAALAPLLGTSLVAFGSGDADRRLARLPQIASARYDRDFPHTLRVAVQAERPAALLRKATDAWLVSGTGRVLGRAAKPYPPLPRIWLAASTQVTLGAPVGPAIAAPIRVAEAVRDRHFPRRVLTIRTGGDGVSFQLASGLDIRLGDTSNLAVKLAVAGMLVPRAEGAAYLDVSVPARAVAGYASSSGQAAAATTGGDQWAGATGAVAAGGASATATGPAPAASTPPTEPRVSG